MARIWPAGLPEKQRLFVYDTQAPQAPRWSAVHGDLSDPAACAALRCRCRTCWRARRAAGRRGARPAPGLLGTRLALRVAGAHGLPAVAVQHHHAHAAAVLAGTACTGR
ncbi:MAG: hypothetical protein R3E55_10355 [Burkholderiaceae bacterium]